MTCTNPCPPEYRYEVLPRVGVVFDLDGTLVDSARDGVPPHDVSDLLSDDALEPTYSEAKKWEDTMQADVVYLTGRDAQLWTASKIWLSNHKLFGKLICKPPGVPLEAVSVWKAKVVAELAVKHRWTHVTVYENNPNTLKAIQCVIPPYSYSPTLVKADGDKTMPESEITGLREKDIINFKLLMNRLTPDDPSWKALLLRKWPSLSSLLDRAQDHVSGKYQRRLFRQMIDELWRPSYPRG